jgi:hypothetical protein
MTRARWRRLNKSDLLSQHDEAGLRAISVLRGVVSAAA